MNVRLDAADNPAHWREAVRVDVGRLAKAKPGAVGVHVPGTIVTTGILTYTKADGTVTRELVPAETLRDPDSLASLRGAPVTIAHPSGGRMVTPETFRRDVVGSVIDPRFDGDRITAELAIQDAEAMRRVDTGELVELSAGYTVMIDPTPGTHRGQRYDGIQKSRRYNHLALLGAGQARAGRDASLRLDGSDAAVMRPDEDDDRTPTRVPARAGQPEARVDSVKTFERIDGREYEVGTDEWRRKLDSMHAAAVEAETKRADAAEKRCTELQAKLDAAEARAKDLETAASPARIDARAAERATLFERVRPILGKEAKLDGLSDHAIRLLVCEKQIPDFKARLDAVAEAQRETYVLGRFEAAVDAPKTATTTTPLDRARIDATTAPGTAAPVLPANAFHIDLGDGAWR